MSWTAKEVGEEITQAYRVLNRTGGAVGPMGYGNSLAEFQGCKNSNPEDVSRMEAVLDILNKMDNAEERKMLMEFHALKARGTRIGEICEKMSIVRRTLYRKIDKLHQSLIESFCLDDRLRHSDRVDQVAQNQQFTHVKGELRHRQKQGSIQGWMEPDARPDIESFGIVEAAE